MKNFILIHTKIISTWLMVVIMQYIAYSQVGLGIGYRVFSDEWLEI